MMERLVVLLFGCVVGGLGLVYPDPENTCPGYLKFQELYGLAVGVLDIPNDGSGEYVLSVNGSLPFMDDTRLKLSMPDYNEIIMTPMRTFKYHLFFPSQKGYPRITSVIFNGKTLCSAPSFPTGVNGNTNVWATYKLMASVQKGVYGSSPSQYPTQQEPVQPQYPNTILQKPPPIIESDNIYFEIPAQFTPKPKPPAVIQPKPSPNPPIRQPNPNTPMIQTYPKEPVIKPSPRPPVVIQPVSIATPTRAPTVEPFTSPSIQKGCGVVLNSIPLVISNDPVAESEFPWMTALLRYSDADKNYQFLCTANLISDKHVITAGHCVTYESLILYDMDELIFVFGKTKLYNWARDATRGYVQKISVHPNYEQDRAGHDIAIFTLTKPVELSGTIYPICLYDSINLPDKGVVAGWGQIKGNKQLHSVTPYKAMMPTVSEEECENAHPVRVGLTGPYVFCAGAKDGTGPCGRDIGAGFMVKLGGRTYLKGVVNHVETKNGTECDLSTYALFTDIATDKDWIKSVMNE